MNELSNLTQDLMLRLDRWYNTSRPNPKLEPNRNAMCAGLATLEAMRGNYPLERNHYLSPRESQVKTSKSKIQIILKRFGESRVLAQEGGRTSRGTVAYAERLVDILNGTPFRGELENLSFQDRGAIIDALQGWLVDRVREYLDQKKIEVEINLDKSTFQIMNDWLAAARTRKKDGAVAQHLVGAKLALRFSEKAIENHSYTTADQQTGRAGDFVMSDTVIHVTVSPTENLIEKCKVNLRNGYRVIILVPDRRLELARGLVEAQDAGISIGVHSIEGFLSQNLDELAEFSKRLLADRLAGLLDKYNERVSLSETDRSLLIEIPENLVE